MLLDRTVLALFADHADASQWSTFCSELPESITIVADRFLDLTLENLAFGDVDPKAAVISSALYPETRPQVVKELKRHFPEIEVVILAPPSAPTPSLELFITDRVRHLFIEPPREKPTAGKTISPLARAIRNLVLKRPWNLCQHVKHDTPIHEFRLSFSEEKEQIIRKLEELIAGDTPELEILRQKGALLADELLENAFYGAPKGDGGLKIFRKGQKRQILPNENMVFRFAYDGEVLAMEMKDGWGSLGVDAILEYLTRNSIDMGAADDFGGRGLFIVWRFLDDFHVRIDPGRETRIGGHLRKSSLLPPEVVHGFHITTTTR